MLRDQHNANTYDLHPHQLSWKWKPWPEQFAWLRNATQLQPGHCVYTSGGCTGQHLRNSRALQLRSSPAHVSCLGGARTPKWACRMNKASPPVQERFLLQGFYPREHPWIVCCLGPPTLAHLLPGSFSAWWGATSAFLAFQKRKTVFPEMIPSSQSCGH